MRKLSSLILKIIAGFFFYMVMLMAFINEPSIGGKLGVLVGFLVFAVSVLGCALALNRFQNWRRDIGFVFLSASGVTAFLVLSFACFLMTDELRTMMKPDTLTFFSDYLTGGVFIVGFSVLGWILVKANRKKIEQS